MTVKQYYQKEELLQNFMKEISNTFNFKVEKIDNKYSFFDVKVTDPRTKIDLFISFSRNTNKDVIISDAGETIRNISPYLADILLNIEDIEIDAINEPRERTAYLIFKNIINPFINVGKNGTLSIFVEPTLNTVIGSCFYMIDKIQEINELSNSLEQ